MVAINCVNLANCKISSLNGIETMNAQFPHLTELDLECNLLNSWSQVFQVLDTFKNLKIINIRYVHSKLRQKGTLGLEVFLYLFH